jgi:hypothetical protein
MEYKSLSVRTETSQRCTFRPLHLRFLCPWTGSTLLSSDIPIMRTNFLAATAIVSALDLLSGVDALALPLRRSSLVSRQANATGSQALADFDSGEAYLTNVQVMPPSTHLVTYCSPARSMGKTSVSRSTPEGMASGTTSNNSILINIPVRTSGFKLRRRLQEVSIQHRNLRSIMSATRSLARTSSRQ